MIRRQQFRKAWDIMVSEGVGSLLHLVAYRAMTRIFPQRYNSIDESGIAFAILECGESTGVVLDIGAHVGNSSRSFALGGWEVHAFEPDPSNRLRLEQALGKCSNVRIDPRAVSAADAREVPFYTSRVSTGISALSAFHPSHEETAAVEVVSLESYCLEQHIESVDYLKTDTEGYDLFVLAGFPWERIRPSLVLCEFEDAKTLRLGYSYHDLAGFLQDRGYRVVVSEWYPVKRYGGPHRWRAFAPYPCELQDPHAWGNIFAVDGEDLIQRLMGECDLKE